MLLLVIFISFSVGSLLRFSVFSFCLNRRWGPDLFIVSLSGGILSGLTSATRFRPQKVKGWIIVYHLVDSSKERIQFLRFTFVIHSDRRGRPS